MGMCMKDRGRKFLKTMTKIDRFFSKIILQSNSRIFFENSNSHSTIFMNDSNSNSKNNHGMTSNR